MLNLIAAMVLTASAAGAGGQDDDADQWACSVSIEGPRSSLILVSLQQTVGGTVVSRSAGWSPPVLDRTAPRDPRPEAPVFTVFYDVTEQGEIGRVQNVLGSAVSVGGPAGTLAGTTLSLDLNGEGPWTAAVSSEGPRPDYRLGDDLVRYRSAFFEAPELPGLMERGGVVTLSLLGADGYLAAQTRYDLTYTGERDQLFIEARDRVTAMMRLAPDEAITRHPESCARATGTLPPELVPLHVVPTP